MPIDIRLLTQLPELHEAVTLQTIYWGSVVESLVPAQMMFTIVKSGGHVIAAFDGKRMVGVLIGLLATSGTPARDHLVIYSKRMLVLPDYRGQGIAQDLKFRQLQTAREQGIGRVTWTYDPLLAVNAHFNIRKLGAISDDYVENYYGQDVDDYGLSIQGISDRLIVQWDANSPGVEQRLMKQFKSDELAQYLEGHKLSIINLSQVEKDIPYPTDAIKLHKNLVVMLEIPRDFRELVNTFPEVARSWRQQTRRLFTTYLCDRHYRVIDFVTGYYEGSERAFYVLQRPDI